MAANGNSVTTSCRLCPGGWSRSSYRLAGHDFAYYLLAQVAVVAALWLVFLTARPIAGPIGALIAVLIVDGLHYFSYTAAKFNHDVIQLPFWALAGFALHRALRGGWLGHWLLLGLAIGISLWAKYFVVVLAVPLAVFIVFDERRAQVAGNARPLHCRRGRPRRSWRRISSGWCRTTSCLLPMPSTARCRRAG